MVSNGIFDDAVLHTAVMNYPTNILLKVLPPGATYQSCDGCNSYIFSKNGHRAYGGKQYVCNRCKDKWYVWCKACESLILKDDNVIHVHAPELQKFLLFNKLDHYKTNPAGGKSKFLCLPSENPYRFFGVEVEIEKDNTRPLPPDLIAKSVASFPTHTVIAKTDGSLSMDPYNPGKNGSNGWELCSLPGTLNYHRDESAGWNTFFETIRPFVQQRPDTTGLHFHVNLDSVEPLTLGKISAWINSASNKDLLMCVADRDFNVPSPQTQKVYAKTAMVNDPTSLRAQLTQVHSMKSHRKDCPYHTIHISSRAFYYHQRFGFKYDRHQHPIIIRIDNDPLLAYKCRCNAGMYNFKDHYAGLNLKTQKATFEFRLFRFSMNRQHFYASMEFVDALIDFCTQASLNNLTTNAFIRWYEASRRRLYPSLTQWLVDRGWLISRKRKDGLHTLGS